MCEKKLEKERLTISEAIELLLNDSVSCLEGFLVDDLGGEHRVDMEIDNKTGGYVIRISA